MNDAASDIASILAAVPDFRVERTRAFDLQALLLGTLIAFVCDSFVDAADFIESQIEWLSQYVDMSNGAPSHDTLARVFRLLDPVALSKAFSECLELLELKLQNKLVAIDGKCLRGSFDRYSDQSAIHVVSAWAVENRLVLGQVKVDEKSNEITAIPRLLEMLDLTGAIVTIDAMGCQRKIAQAIVEKGADYVLAVKGNQPELEEAITFAVDSALDGTDPAVEFEHGRTLDKHHGRFEERRYVCMSADAIEWADLEGKWPGLSSLVGVECRTTKNGRTSTQRRYFISSLRPDGPTQSRAVRGHWGIENSLHWVLDVVFREDDSRVRLDHSPENLAVLRHLTLNILRRDETKNMSIRRKRKKASREPLYREQLLKN